MKVLFPSYYKHFSCIADRCRHSCCIGWEIDVDDATMERYRAIGAVGEDILSHISGEPASIQLCEGERCPFLDGDGLCKIISSLGEGAVSRICREHPRFYHTVRGRTEGGIGAVCEEACRIILSCDGFDRFVEYERDIEDVEETEFNSIKHRNYLHLLCFDDILRHSERILIIREKYEIPDPIYKADEWNKILSDLEYLDKSRVGSLTIGKRLADKELEIYLTRFLAYLIFRHVSPATSYDNMRARICFCFLICEILENTIAEGGHSFEEIVEFARIISEEIEYSEDNTASLILEMESIV